METEAYGACQVRVSVSCLEVALRPWGLLLEETGRLHPQGLGGGTTLRHPPLGTGRGGSCLKPSIVGIGDSRAGEPTHIQL